MTRNQSAKSPKEVTVIKRILTIALVAMMIVAFGASIAFAEGYNSENRATTAAELTAGYGADKAGTNNNGSGLYTRATGYFAGPHGGYATTTNKCQDCHSTHYAYGDYMLLRANDREAACDYCHGGGGGSTVNIMMDNTYRMGSFDPLGADGQHQGDADENMNPAAISNDTTALAGGPGTGHTLGFAGNAPADIQPAFTDANGFACFDCHSPHGNSARIMTTFSNPGRHFAAPGQAGRPTSAAMSGGASWPVEIGVGGMVNGAAGSFTDNGVLNAGEWGVDDSFGNFVWDSNNASANVQPAYRPIWPTGRFLLLTNPHGDAAEGTDDMNVTDTATELAQNGENKYAINWTEPLGPADAPTAGQVYGGGQDNDNDKDRTGGFPFIANDGDATTGGFLSESEFCVDCHDGSAGASTQSALVWNATETTYTVAYSHDAQPRH